MPHPAAPRFVLGVALLLAAGCTGSGGAGRDTAVADTATRAVAESLAFTALGEVGARELDESSGLAASAREPGLYWSMNDDTDALLFALSATGEDRGRLRLTGARNVDWESIAIGPCDTVSCLYVGDTGDNDARRPTRTIYRVPEPARRDGAFAPVRAQELSYRYQDGPKDVEAMYVARDGAVWLISKRPLRDGSGRHRPSLVYRLDPEHWTRRGGDLAVAQLVDSLRIIPGSSPTRLITDAALSPDSRVLAVRTYGELYLFDADSATGRPSAGAPRRVCDLTPVGERQGEGIAWESQDGTFLLTSEGSETPKTRSSMTRVRCMP
ncbi:MAG TPA: hypothetical protein VEA99_09110 [Gemmatimonadaceae bacterium]|nr:hypothetical protein [Gemmatimonadaceae bacterium]